MVIIGGIKSNNVTTVECIHQMSQKPQNKLTHYLNSGSSFPDLFLLSKNLNA